MLGGSPRGEEIMMAGFVSLFADSDGYHMGDWGGGWMWLFGMPMMIGFVALIVWLVRAGNSSEGPAPREPVDRGREILAERYAKGELSTEEYRERSSELR
jgi:putative membrane protein